MIDHEKLADEQERNDIFWIWNSCKVHVNDHYKVYLFLQHDYTESVKLLLLEGLELSEE